MLLPLAFWAHAFEYQRPLTDQEKKETQNFQHSGLIQRAMEEECAKNEANKAACSGKKATAFGGSQDNLIRTAGQAFSLFMGQLGDISSSKKNSGLDPSNDYCGMIPPAITVVAQTTQIGRQNHIGANAPGHSAQKEYLYKQSRAHRARAKTTSIEIAGWGTTTACYIGLSAAKFGFQVNKSTYLRMGAAAFLTYFYQRQKKNHNKYADIVKNIADSLPGKGDCNPITERDCYCAQPETSEDPQYCLAPGTAPKNLPLGAVAVSCVNANMQADPNCHCRSKNSCADVRFRPLFNIPAFSHQTTAGKMMRDLARLPNGRFYPAQLAQSSLGQGAFRRALGEIDKNIPENDGALSKKQKSMAALFRKSGIPRRLAAQMARSPISSRGRGFVARLKQQTPSHSRTPISAIPAVSDKTSLRKKAASSKKSNPFAFLKKKQRSPQNQDDIIRFSQEAQSKSSISHKRGANIFQLISHRYQNGGWEKLEFDMPR